MKEKYSRITIHSLHSRPLVTHITRTTSFIRLLVAGITGASCTAYKKGSIYGGIVNRTACADPTPGPVTLFLQAVKNYSSVSAHPYSGLSSSIPATCFYNQSFFCSRDVIRNSSNLYDAHTGKSGLWK